MKKRAILMMLALCAGLWGSVYAFQPAPMETVQKRLQYIEGTWYDKNGNPAIVIQDGYLNGCRILAGGYPAGGGENFGMQIEIEEDTGPRIMQIGVSGSGYHRRLTVDHSFYSISSGEEDHYESIGGVYLGMPKDELRQLWGAPSQIRNSYWQYDKKGIVVEVEGRVSRIRIYPSCTLSLQRSGVNARTPRDDIYRAYGQKSPGPKYKAGVIEVGHGEWILVYPDYIELSMLPIL